MAVNDGYGYVAQELDDLSIEVLSSAFDLLADGEDVGVLLGIGYRDGDVEALRLTDDGPEALLQGARAQVSNSHGAIRYAIAYEGAIELDDGSFADAVLLEFGEKGHRSFSAYSLFEGRGEGDGFRFTDPAPAGEEEALLG
jgi:hypothetical protein